MPVERTLRKLQGLVRQPPTDRDRTVLTRVVPDDLASAEVKVLLLTPEEVHTFETAKRELLDDPRFEHILSAKGRKVITIEPERTLGEAVRLLDERKIGAVVVGDADHAVLGIISERDIVRALAKSGAAALDEPVSRHMTGKVVTCTGGDNAVVYVY